MNPKAIILQTLRKFPNGAEVQQIMARIPKRYNYSPPQNYTTSLLSSLKRLGVVKSDGVYHNNKWYATDAYYRPRMREMKFTQSFCECCQSPIVYPTGSKSGQLRKHCSIKCAGEASTEYKKKPDHERPKAKCEVCGKVFIKKFNSANRACSRDCGFVIKKIEADNHREGKYFERTGRIYDRTRGYPSRAKKFGCHYEKVDLRKIFKRDNWKCTACGIDTPKSLRGTFHNQAPEIDHVIPMSKGGPHTEWNLQALCRKCNGIKMDMYNNQFILTHIIGKIA